MKEHFDAFNKVIKAEMEAEIEKRLKDAKSELAILRNGETLIAQGPLSSDGHFCALAKCAHKDDEYVVRCVYPDGSTGGGNYFRNLKGAWLHFVQVGPGIKVKFRQHFVTSSGSDTLWLGYDNDGKPFRWYSTGSYDMSNCQVLPEITVTKKEMKRLIASL